MEGVLEMRQPEDEEDATEIGIRHEEVIEVKTEDC